MYALGSAQAKGVFSTMVGGENCRRRKLSTSVFSQKFSSCDISQTGTDIEDPFDDNVHDMEKNNISKYRSDPTVEDGVITVVFFAINMSSLQPLSKLSLALASHSKIENRMIFIVLSSY
jgi:hypothetical protein